MNDQRGKENQVSFKHTPAEPAHPFHIRLRPSNNGSAPSRARQIQNRNGDSQSAVITGPDLEFVTDWQVESERVPSTELLGGSHGAAIDRNSLATKTEEPQRLLAAALRTPAVVSAINE